jgi:RHS repeat-associated protein
LNYSYDATGNRTGDARDHLRHQYAYDALDQLTAVWRQSHRGSLHPEEVYSYDAVGNRLTGPDHQAYQYDAANRLTQDRTHAYAYDANGNLIEKRRLRDGRVITYTYDAEDRLIQVLTPRTEVTFQYDPLGRRIEKRVIRWHDEDGDHEPDPDEEAPPRTIRYLYDQEDILTTFDETGRENARYTHGPGIDEPLAEVRRHRTRLYHADVLGSVIALTGSHGHPIRHYSYSAYGIPGDHRWDPQPYRYTGREWDKEVGLYYYRTRYYTFPLGRFLSEDPVQDDLSLGARYVYVKNNPLRFVDPTGKLWEPQPGVPGPMVLKPIESPLLRAAAITGIISTGLLKIGVGAITVSVGAGSIPETGPAGLIVAGAGVLLITTGVAQVGGGIALIPVLFPLATLPPSPGGQPVCPVETAPVLLPTP